MVIRSVVLFLGFHVAYSKFGTVLLGRIPRYFQRRTLNPKP